MKQLCVSFLLLVTGMFASTVAIAQSGSNSHLTMNQWVHLAEDGALIGRVLIASTNGQASTLEAVKVSLRSQSGSTHVVQTDRHGKFRVDELKSGVYSLISKGSDTFASVALHVLPIDDGLGYGFPSIAEISTARIQSATVQMAITRYLPPNLEQSNASIENADLEKLASQVYGSELSQVVQIDGGMRGKIFRAGAEGITLVRARRTNVFLFQNGVEVARELTDDRGRFEIDQLAVGHYSILAIGRDGIGSIGFVLVDQEQAKKTTQLLSSGKDAQTLVMQNSCCGVQEQFAMQIAPVPGAFELLQETMPCQDFGSNTCGTPIPACGCGEVVSGGGVVEGGIVEGGFVDSGIAQQGGFTGYNGGGGGGGGGGFGGGGGGGFGGFGGFGGGGGGLGALGGLGVLAATSGGGIAPLVAPIAASPSAP